MHKRLSNIFSRNTIDYQLLVVSPSTMLRTGEVEPTATCGEPFDNAQDRRSRTISFKSIKLLIFTICITLWLLLLSVKFNTIYAASIGVSPGGIYNENFKPGTKFEQEFIISRGNPDKTVLAEIQVDAEDFEEWMTITPGTEVTLPAGTQRIPFTVTLNIPEEAAFGKYEGYLRVTLRNENQGQVSIQPAVRLDLNFLLTEKDVRLFEAQNAIVKDTNEKSPLTIELKVRNNGNVTGAPGLLELEVYTLKEILVDSYSSNEIPDIYPFTTETVNVVINKHGLAPGTYIGKIIVKDLGETLLTDKSIFNVYEGGEIDLSNLPETGDESLLERIKDLLKDSLLKNLTSLKDFISRSKYYLIGGFLFISFLIIFILLLVDRDKEEEDDDEETNDES